MSIVAHHWCVQHNDSGSTQDRSLSHQNVGQHLPVINGHGQLDGFSDPHLYSSAYMHLTNCRGSSQHHYNWLTLILSPLWSTMVQVGGTLHWKALEMLSYNEWVSDPGPLHLTWHLIGGNNSKSGNTKALRASVQDSAGRGSLTGVGGCWLSGGHWWLSISLCCYSVPRNRISARSILVLLRRKSTVSSEKRFTPPLTAGRVSTLTQDPPRKFNYSNIILSYADLMENFWWFMHISVIY